MARRQKLNPFETGPRSGEGGKGKDVIEALAIRPRWDHAGGEEPFYFRSEKKPVALPTPIERRDAKTIATEVKLALSFVPQRNRELPVQFSPRCFALLLPGMGDDLGIAMGEEAMTPAGELFAALDVVEEFA